MNTPRSLAALSSAVVVATLLSTNPLSAQWAGEWKFDETMGTTAADLTTKKNDGTLMNFSAAGHWGPGKFGNALTFDGTDDYVDLPTGNGLPIYTGTGEPYSIAFWVKAPAQRDKRVYSEGSNSSNTPIITIGSGTTFQDRIRIYFRADGGHTVINTHGNGTVFDDTWHHVTWVDVSGNTKLYVDGNLDSTDHYTRKPGAANFGTWTMNKASVGAVLRASTCCLLNGSVDDLRIYNFALRPADIGLIMLDVSLIPAAGSIGFYGQGCNGSLAIWAAGSTAPGGTLNLSLSRGTPSALAQLVIGAPIAPFDMGAIGFPGCTVYPALATSTIIVVGVLDAAGTVSPIALPIPNNPALNGLLGGIQGAAIASGALQMSGAVLLHIGR